MLDHIVNLPGTCTEEGPKEIHGFGNFNLIVNGNDKLPALQLFFFDSGEGYNIHGGYDWIHV